jgi:catechol 2,3-dioxygenase-like lactoylglutathione lyase family enzyme
MLRLLGLHHFRLRVKDFEGTKRFAADFGLSVATEINDCVYMRGSGHDMYNYVAERGNNAELLSIAFAVEGVEDLNQAVREYGATPVRSLDGPGGGQAVTLKDPEGRSIDLVAGIEKSEPARLRPALTVNCGTAKERRGVRQVTAHLGPPQLLRLGHVGIFVENYVECDRWYRDVLGLLPSDLLYAGPPENIVAGWYRLNRGDEWVDHHTIALLALGKSNLHHVSFEVQDSESLFVGHRWMTGRGWQSIWGVGRHPLGSHMFDLWRDPNGYRFEMFTDTDIWTANKGADFYPIEAAAMDLWSDEHHAKYFE